MKKLLLSLILIIAFQVSAQDPTRFQEDVEIIKKKYDTLWDHSRETVVFTGSSSIRIWHDLQERFPNHQIVNTGFGGSQATDLLNYSYDLVLRFKPSKVFIYEGDNDISAKKKPKHIVRTMERIISGIRKNRADTEVVLIAAKPSIARWKLKGKYKRLNRKFERLVQKDGMIQFANVWEPMLDGRKVRQDIFKDDGLHMNSVGYEIWYGVLKEYLQ